MKIAIVGSRNMIVYNIGNYVSDGEEIVTGGASGIARCAAEYVRKSKGSFKAYNLKAGYITPSTPTIL